jgi:hypothetical protein
MILKIYSTLNLLYSYLVAIAMIRSIGSTIQYASYLSKSPLGRFGIVSSKNVGLYTYSTFTFQPCPLFIPLDSSTKFPIFYFLVNVLHVKQGGISLWCVYVSTATYFIAQHEDNLLTLQILLILFQFMFL